MAARLRHLIATFGAWQWTLTAVFIVALALAGFFGARTLRYTSYWRQHRDEPIERWMPVDYIARSYGVPPEVLWAVLEPADASAAARHDRRPLSEIAEARGQTFEELRDSLLAAIAGARPGLAPTASARPPGPSGGGGGP